MANRLLARGFRLNNLIGHHRADNVSASIGVIHQQTLETRKLGS